MRQTALILGASGRFGCHAAEAFWNAGWQVRLFDRETDTLQDAAKDVQVIVNGWNPPYTEWASQVPRLTNRVIDAARRSGATVILPGNVYVFGPDAGPILSKDTPHKATNPLGRIRIEMETAYRDSGVQTLLLRAGDFIDTEASGNWFDKVITAKAARGRIVSPGAPANPHAWSFLPDLARAAVALAERRECLDRFEDIPFPGYTLSIDDIAALIEQATGRAQRVTPMSWLPLYAAAPFWPMGRKLFEMRYLWSMPHRLDGTRFNTLLPGFRETDPCTALGHAVADLNIHPDKPVAGGKRYIAAE
jgi:nucleoside-diphosphate-sugar epimerase